MGSVVPLPDQFLQLFCSLFRPSNFRGITNYLLLNWYLMKFTFRCYHLVLGRGQESLCCQFLESLYPLFKALLHFFSNEHNPYLHTLTVFKVHKRNMVAESWSAFWWTWISLISCHLIFSFCVTFLVLILHGLGTPRLLSLRIAGTAVEGTTLNVEKKYWGGEEGDSIYRWFRVVKYVFKCLVLLTSK